MANYESIWTKFSTSVRGIAGRALQRTKRFVAMSIGGATNSQMYGGNFPKREQSNADFVPNTTHGYY